MGRYASTGSSRISASPSLSRTLEQVLSSLRGSSKGQGVPRCITARWSQSITSPTDHPCE